VIQPNPPRTKSRLTKELMIALLLLLIPLGATVAATVPAPAEYVIRGEMVPVRDVGVDGSVYISVVDSGIVTNWFERMAIATIYRNDYPDIEFTRIPTGEVEAYLEDLTETESLAYAVEQAVEQSESLPGDEDEAAETDGAAIEARTAEILANLDNYSGDSLGLMMAIGLYEEKHGINFSDKLDLEIAGTGTMETDGYVGPIGGLKHKLLGAEEAGIDLFFVPADYDWLGEAGNEAEAERLKEELRLTMTIVPVETLEEAIGYLQQS